MPHSVRKGHRLAAAFSLALATGVLTVMPTAAQAAEQSCPLGYACIWRDIDFETDGVASARIQFTKYIPDLNQWKYAGTNYYGQNSASSFFNNGRYEEAWICDAPYARGWFNFGYQPGTGVADLRDASLNNDAESLYFDSWMPI